MHTYDWLENFKKDECKDIHLLNLYRFLDFRTREAFWQYENSDKKPKVIIFCTYKDKRYKIVGASRLGDIWLIQTQVLKTGMMKELILMTVLTLSLIK